MPIFAAILTCLMITVMITDVSRFIIPNWLVLVLILLYPVMLYFTPQRPDWQMALLIGLGTFAVGFGLFVTKIMGGGDVKLLAVCAVWAGKAGFPEFIMGVGLLGGVLALALLLCRPFAAYLFSKRKKPVTIPRLLTIDEAVPYGLAIAVSFLLVLWGGKMPGIVL